MTQQEKHGRTQQKTNRGRLVRQRVAELNKRHMRRTSIKIKQDITNTKTITET